MLALFAYASRALMTPVMNLIDVVADQFRADRGSLVKQETHTSSQSVVVRPVQSLQLPVRGPREESVRGFPNRPQAHPAFVLYPIIFGVSMLVTDWQP